MHTKDTRDVTLYKVPKNISGGNAWSRKIQIAPGLKSDSYKPEIRLDSSNGYSIAKWRQLYSDPKLLIQKIHEQIHNKEFMFPFQSRFVYSIFKIFNNYKNYQPRIVNKEYELCGYYGTQLSKMQNKNGYTNLIIQPDMKDYFEMDVLSDFYFENQRIHAKKHNTNSLWNHWCSYNGTEDWVTHFWDQPFVSFEDLRNYLYSLNKEVKQFRLSWIKGIFQILLGTPQRLIHVLDMSSGWGDRLIGSIGMGYHYTGFDPNPLLQSGYNRIIEHFGNNEYHKVICQSFEDAQLPNDYYDICLSSPPFYDQEIYNVHDSGQSIAKYPSLEEWIQNFLLVSLHKIYKSIKPGGYIAIHLADTPRFQICDPMIQYYDTINDLEFKGVIAISGAQSRPTPVWVWKRKDLIV